MTPEDIVRKKQRMDIICDAALAIRKALDEARAAFVAEGGEESDFDELVLGMVQE